MGRRKFDGATLVIASHNQGKVREIAELLTGHVERVASAKDLGLPEPAETGTTFVENATIKALSAAKGAGHPALADDSGICVDALMGAPGVYTADWAVTDDGSRDFGLAMAKVNDLLMDTAPHGEVELSAHFVCCLALAWPDGHVETVEGRVDGHLVWPIRGDKGFGFDPMFVPNGFDETFGEMDPRQKAEISHRTDAFRQLLETCF